MASTFGVAVAATNDDWEDDAFETELIALRTDLFRMGMMLTQSPAHAEDLVQDAMERALLARNRYNRGTNLKAWAASILRNRFLDSWRHENAARSSTRQISAELPIESERGPLDLLSFDDVEEALSGLPEGDRRIFTAFYLHRRSYDDISRELNIPVATTGTRIYRAKRKLRRALERTYEQRAKSPP